MMANNEEGNDSFMYQIYKNQFKKSFLLNEGGYRDGKITSGTRGCIPHSYIFVHLLYRTVRHEKRGIAIYS